jgi:carbon-monoxide dehydrogenase small subunit
LFAVQAVGSEITTVEGLTPSDGTLSPVQEAFRDEHGLQCGFCTPGFVVSLTAFLAEHTDPTDDDLRDALSGNLCRCTGYQGIVRAARAAADRLKDVQ